MHIKAIKPFAHESRAFQPGDTAQTSASAGKWLIAQGVAVEIQAEKPQKPAKPEKTDETDKAEKA